ncbi:endonuclease domain-containing protein [Nocardia ignorata]|uniref:endonuclease domain-containing protein n=1 Tax=Nocardia ignorata TaxID=145285 RepID=UPI00362E2431
MWDARGERESLPSDSTIRVIADSAEVPESVAFAGRRTAHPRSAGVSCRGADRGRQTPPERRRMTPEFVNRVLAAWSLVRAELEAKCDRGVDCIGRAAVGTPACCRHLSKQERETAEFMREGARVFVDRWLPALWPACWFWSVPDGGYWATPTAIYQWQNGKCAICAGAGDKGGHWGMVLDHDHRTGLVRVWLCRNCNAVEGHSTTDGRWLNYRNRPPATILGVRRLYSKRGSKTRRVPGPGQLTLEEL